MLLVAEVAPPGPDVPEVLVPGRLLEVPLLAWVALVPVRLPPVFPLRKSGGASFGSQPDNSIPTPTIPTQALIAGHRNSRGREQATKVGEASWLTVFPCED